MKQKGFTLIELLVVVAIIGILASVVIASLNSARQKGSRAAGLRFSSSTYNAMGDQTVGVWDFDECSGSTVADKSGNGNTGSFQSGATWSTTNTPTGIGCSLSLDGIDDYVLVSTDELSDAEGSIFAWAYPTATAANSYVFQGNNDAPLNRLYLQWTTSFNAVRSNPSANIIIKSNPALNTWHHIGLSWKDGLLTAYYNGAQAGTATSFSYLGGSYPTSYIGQQAGGAKNFPGLIDDVRLYSRSLTAFDVQNIYAEGLEKFKLADR